MGELCRGRPDCAQPAHPLYAGLCEDCWALRTHQVAGSLLAYAPPRAARPWQRGRRALEGPHAFPLEKQGETQGQGPSREDIDTAVSLDGEG